MPSSTTFTGAFLRLESVVPINSAATLKVKFTQDPQQSNPAGPNDALNVANYTLTGPLVVAITSAATVGGDPQSIYLTLAAPLAAGLWTLAVANIETTSLAGLLPPVALQFAVTGAQSSRLNAGSANDDAEEIIRKHISPGMAQFQPGWSALIAALSVGDQTNFNNAEFGFDQLYKSTASGIYLDRRSADDGIIRPEDVGISDDVFRRLSIKTTTKKVVTQALLEILEVYYGTDSTRAHLITDLGEPYNIQDGWTLSLSIDGDPTITIPFSASDFAQVSQAQAIEVAAVITRWLKANGSTAYALEVVDADTGAKKVIIYSGALGLESSVQVLGGEVQNVVRFPTFLTQAQAANTWSVTKPGPGIAEYKISGATTTDLTQVFVGDYVNVFGNGFAAANQGTFVITDVDVRFIGATLTQFIQVRNDFAVTQSTVTIVTPNDLVFFRPTKTTINDNGARAVVVSQSRPREVDIQFPATTVAVSRTARSAAYLQTPVSLVPVSVIRHADGTVTVSFSGNHGLSQGSQVLLSGITPSGVAPSTVPGNGTSTTDASLVTIWSTVAAPSGNAVQFAESLTLTDGRVFITGGKTSAPAAAADTRIFAITGSSVLGNGEVQYTYTWTAKTPIPVARYSHRMSLLTDLVQAGNVLLTGGYDGTNPPFATAYLYDIGANTWTSTTTPMTVARQDHAQLTLADSRVLIVGGRNASAGTQTATSELFTPTGATGVFNATTGAMFHPRYSLGLFQTADGTVIAAGGYTAVGNTAPTETCEAFNVTTQLWTPASSMTFRRGGAVVIPLGNDRFLIAGGTGRGGTEPSTVADIPQATTEIFDGSTKRWYAGPLMTTARANLRAVTINGADIVMTGTTAGADYLNLASLRWSPVRDNPGHFLNSAVARASFNGVDLVLVYGGSTNGVTPLANASLLVRASDFISNGGLMFPAEVSSIISPSVFQFLTPENLGYTSNVDTGAIVTPFRALPATTIPGPYILDPDGGAAVTGVASALTFAIDAGSQYATLKLTPGTAVLFPDEPGWLALGFGTGSQLTPVKYLGLANSDELLLDFSTVFPIDLAVGTSVTLLSQRGPFNPDNPETLGVFYLTDSSSGRVAASDSIDAVVAAGIIVEKTIVYPGDRGLGNEGFPDKGVPKLSDRVGIWAGNDEDAEVEAAREDV